MYISDIHELQIFSVPPPSNARFLHSINLPNSRQTLSPFCYLASTLPPTLFCVQLASFHRPQGLVLVHSPKLRNQQLRRILELKCFTRFFWTQPKASTDRRSPLLLRHIKIPVVTVTEGTVKYEMFIFVLLFPVDTVVITVSAPRPLFRQCYLSVVVLQRQFSFTVPPAERHSSFVSQPSP